MFKRSKPRTYGQLASELVYPRGGFRRSTAYLWHRIRRLPDQPHRIARGLAAGVFLSFTPLHGFHFIVAALVSLAIVLALWAALQVGLDVLSRHPRLYNYPAPLTSANVQRLYRVGEQMMVWLCACVAIMFLGVVGMVLGLPSNALSIMALVGTIVACFGGIIRLSNAS